VKCPSCKKDVAEPQPHYPFCGERCKQLDLGRWAAEEFVISTPVESRPGKDEDGGTE